ncbi:MAG: serine protease [Bdellovibrionota bacterium]
MRIHLVFLSMIIFSAKSLAAIYGKDDLVPVFKAPTAYQNAAKSVAVFTGRNFLTLAGNQYKLQMWTLDDSAYLCKDSPWHKYEAFPVACTGFLIAPDLMITAGHCMVNFGEATNEVTPQCRDFVFIFDMDFNFGLKVPRVVQETQVAECAQVIKAVHNSIPDPKTGKSEFKDDYALIRLKKPMPYPLVKLSDVVPAVAERISFIGHPLGTGKMYGTGKILSKEPTYLRSNLDAFEGHSGSPVFNQAGEVFGALVRGYPETLIEGQDQTCNLINHCDEDGIKCQQNDLVERHMGEHVQPLSKTFVQSLLQGQ